MDKALIVEQPKNKNGGSKNIQVKPGRKSQHQGQYEHTKGGRKNQHEASKKEKPIIVQPYDGDKKHMDDPYQNKGCP